jgi:hypothetical protein
MTANFVINTYGLTVNVGMHGQSNLASQTVNWGSMENFKFTPDTGYSVADVMVNGTIDEGAVTSLSPTVTGPTTVDVSFAINTYTIAVTQTANGVIAPETSNVNYGATPTFTITPNTGYYIVSITANGASVTVTSPSGQSYQFSAVSAAGSLTATFAINTYTIAVTQGANGVIAPGTTVVNYGDSQTFTITPNRGYYIASITTDAGSVTVTSPAGQTVSLTNVQAAYTISATFAPTPISTPTPSPSATATPTPAPTPTPKPTATSTPTITPTPTPTSSATTRPATSLDFVFIVVAAVAATSLISSAIAIKRSRRKPDNVVPAVVKTNPENPTPI